jgi:hypothetical protein
VKPHFSLGAVFLILFVFVGLGGVPALRAQDDSGADFAQSRAFKKLDADTQQAWQEAMQANDPERRFDCFVRVRAPADRGDQSFLFSAGFVVRMFSGNVASGYMAAKDLPRVARLDFVDSIRLSKTPQPGVQKVDRPAKTKP